VLATVIDVRVAVELVVCEVFLPPPPHPAMARQATKAKANKAPNLFI
jgi:hypothetical protein